MSDPFETILVDFDGVLRRWPVSDEAIEGRFGLPAGSIRAEAFSPASLGEAIRGAVPDAEWRRRTAEALHRCHPGSDAFGAVRAWSAGPGAIDRGALDTLLRHEPSGGLVLFTNATSRLDDDLEALGVRGVFRAVVSSSEVGAAKPESAMFRAGVRACGGDAGRIVYVDDAPENVAAARAMGISSHAYRSVDALERFLRGGLPTIGR